MNSAWQPSKLCSLKGRETSCERVRSEKPEIQQGRKTRVITNSALSFVDELVNFSLSLSLSLSLLLVNRLCYLETSEVWRLFYFVATAISELELRVVKVYGET